jgi:hypothetical protein
MKLVPNALLCLTSLCLSLLMGAAFLLWLGSRHVSAGAIECQPAYIHQVEGREADIRMMKPEVAGRCRKEPLFDFSFQLDSHGRRAIPAAATSPRPEKPRVVLLLGCSYTFGTGVRDDETFAHWLQLKLGKRYLVVNAAVPSTSALHAIGMLREKEIFLPGLPGEVAHVVYTLIPDQVFRVAGKGRWLLDEARSSTPIYDMAGERAVYLGQRGIGQSAGLIRQWLDLAGQNRSRSYVMIWAFEGARYGKKEVFA